MKKHFFLSILVCLLFSLAAFAGEGKQCERKRPFIDLFDLLALYMLPASAQPGGAPSWWTGAQPDSPIEWHTSGVKDGKREGEVVVTIDGKPIYAPKGPVKPTSWVIILIGERSGIRQIDLSPRTSGFADSFDLEDEFRKRRISFELYKWDGHGWASHSEKIYKIEVLEKKPAWLYYVWSCGSAGCWSRFQVFLNKDDADKLPNLVDPSTHLKDDETNE
jgi:hypothetical protein